MLIFGDVTDVRESFAGDRSRVCAENRGVAFVSAKNVYQDFDERGFAGAVGADESVNAVFSDGKSEVVESFDAAIVFAEGLGFDGAVHRAKPVL